MTPEELDKINPQERFKDRAEDYAKYRPAYPPEAIDFILEGVGKLSGLRVADIGAGTGISSQLLANRGIQVIGIEPNAAMRQVAKAHPLVEFKNGSAEKTTLADKSVDLVTCFQAFHWFEPGSTLKEFSRILKPRGQLALVWNDRDIDGNDEFTREHDRIITTASNNSSIHALLDGKSDLLPTSVFSVVKYAVFCHQQTFSKDGLIGLAMSASYIPKSGSRYQQMIENLTELYEKYCDSKGLVYLQYKTKVYLSSLL